MHTNDKKKSWFKARLNCDMPIAPESHFHWCKFIFRSGTLIFQMESTTIRNMLFPTHLFLMTHPKGLDSVSSVFAQINLRHSRAKRVLEWVQLLPFFVIFKIIRKKNSICTRDTWRYYKGDTASITCLPESCVDFFSFFLLLLFSFS